MEQKIELDGTYMNVIKFGSGIKNLIVISGVSLTGLEGSVEAIEKAMEIFSRNFTVYVFERKKILHENYTMKEMSEDIYKCLKILGVNKTSVYGASQGGMISQILATDHPDLVEKLVLCSTTSRMLSSSQKVFDEWEKAAEAHDVEKVNSLFLDYVYSDSYKESIKEYIPSLLKNGTAEDCDRFCVIVESMRSFDISEKLQDIKCPVFLLCDKNDKVFNYTCSLEINRKIKSEIFVYDKYSHAVYDEAPDFIEKAAEFLCK